MKDIEHSLGSNIDPITQIFMDFYADLMEPNDDGETTLINYQDWAEKARKAMSEEINARYDLVPKDDLFAFEEESKEDIDKEIDEILKEGNKDPVKIAQEWIDEGKIIGRKEALDEAIYKTMMISNQFHGGGNGRRLFVELIDILQELKK